MGDEVNPIFDAEAIKKQMKAKVVEGKHKKTGLKTRTQGDGPTFIVLSESDEKSSMIDQDTFEAKTVKEQADILKQYSD